jgi:hypothetical protein
MLPSLAGPLPLRDNLQLTPNTPRGLWPTAASGRQQPLERPQIAPWAKSRIGINWLCRGSNSRRPILKFS